MFLFLVFSVHFFVGPFALLGSFIYDRTLEVTRRQVGFGPQSSLLPPPRPLVHSPMEGSRPLPEPVGRQGGRHCPPLVQPVGRREILPPTSVNRKRLLGPFSLVKVLRVRLLPAKPQQRCRLRQRLGSRVSMLQDVSSTVSGLRQCRGWCPYLRSPPPPTAPSPSGPCNRGRSFMSYGPRREHVDPLSLLLSSLSRRYKGKDPVSRV